MITFAKFWRKVSAKTGKVYYQGSGAGDARFLLFENSLKNGPDDPDLILKVVEKQQKPQQPSGQVIDHDDRNQGYLPYDAEGR